MIPLRKYQEEAIEACREALCEGKRRFVINLPTGTGKTITALSMVASSIRRGNRVLWIAHRDELISQTADTFHRVAADLESCGIVKADLNENHKQFVIASVQTLWGRDREVERERAKLELALEDCATSEVEGIQSKLNSLPPPSFPRWESLKPETFSMVVYDECHHSASPAALKLLESIPSSSMLLGLSATPFRGDGLSIKGVFSDGIVYQLPLKQAIREGYLCDYKYQSVWLDIDLEKIKTTAGDYNAAQLEDALETSGVVEATSQGIFSHARDRKGIVFTFTIKQALETAQALRDLGLDAEAVSDETKRDDRRRILKDFKNGKTKWICNCAVLTEGYDEPSADCVVVARPTKSKPLYTQMAGRGLRLFPGKENCLILDFVASGKRNPPAGVRDLIGVLPAPGETSEEAEKREEKEKIEAGLPRDPVAIAMLKAAEEARLKKKAFAAAWVVLARNPPGVVEARAISGSKKRKVVIFTQDQERERWKCYVWFSKGFYRIENNGVNLEFAEDIGRNALEAMGQKTLMESGAAWRLRTPSEKMLGMANQWRIEIGQGWSAGEVSDAINSVTASADLKGALSGNKQQELFFHTPEDFKQALKEDREQSEMEYNAKKAEKKMRAEAERAEMADYTNEAGGY